MSLVRVNAWGAEFERGLRERETVTVRCAWCSWSRTGSAPTVTSEQREHVQGHPEYRPFDRKRLERKLQELNEKRRAEARARQRANEQAYREENRERLNARQQAKRIARRGWARLRETCAVCDAPIPPERKATALYCSRRCAIRAATRRRAEQREITSNR